MYTDTISVPRILGIDYFRKGYFKDPSYQWTFGIATKNTEKIEQLSILPDLLDNPSA